MVKISIYIFFILFLSGCGYANYDECLLEEMKGQTESMLNTAEKVCERKYPYEKELYSFRDGEIDLGFSHSGDGIVYIQIEENKTDYEITRAYLVFSNKKCKESDKDDFNINIEVEFESGDDLTNYVSYKTISNEFQCMRTLNTFGVIK